MNDQTRSRPVIDLDELERQLREASQPRSVAPAAAAGRDDPLAELARIVGQDDPYRSARQAPRPAAPAARFEPSDFEAELAALSRGQPFAPRSAPAEPASYAEAPAAPPVLQARAAPTDQEWDLRPTQHDDRFDQPRAAQPAYAQPAQPAYAAEAPAYGTGYAAESEPAYTEEGQLPPHETVALAPRRSRRAFYATLVIGGISVLGLASGYFLRNAPNSTQMAGGAPPMIKADAGPTKVVPENPGGVEVPNQNRQIYNRGTPEDTKGAKVVGGEEQPVDVNQVARATPRAIVPGTSAAPAPSTTTAPASAVELPKPPQTTALAPGLGEPRKVRTVSVRPDGSIIEDGDASAGAPAARSMASLVAATAPSPTSTASTSPAAAPAPRPRPEAGATPVAVPTARPTPTTTTTTTAPAAPVAPKPVVTRPVATQVASTQPVAPLEVTEPASSGAWTVQLAAPPSEQEAKDTASRLSRRFAGELGDMRPAIRKAEVNGKTIFRVRVGSLSRDEATGLCEKLKTAGGQCFVAKN